MHILKNFILTLCIINFFSLGNIKKIDAAFFLPRKQANIGFVGFSNSGKTSLMNTLAGLPHDFDGANYHNLRDEMVAKSLIVNNGKGQDYAVDCNLWNTTGQPKDKDRVINFRCKYMDIVIIAVDLARPDWRQEIRRNILDWQHEILDINPNAKIILACTKSDLVDPNQLNTIEATINNFTDGVQALGGSSIRSLVLSAKTGHHLNALMQIIEDDLREIGLDNLRDVDEKLPLESSGGCLLL